LQIWSEEEGLVNSEQGSKDKDTSGGESIVEEPIRFGDTVLKENLHICAFFCSPEEEYQVLLPFIKEGFDRGEKAFHVVDPEMRQDHLERLKAAGIDTVTTEQSGQFQLSNWDEAYFPDGRFDQERMLATWRDLLGDAVQPGLPRTRLVAHMEWALEDREGVTDLVEYEARFNLLHAQSRDPVICAYDLRKFPANLIIDTLRTHPMVIMGGLLQKSPFYTPPEMFLQELHARRAS
jgi:MEDS: MEthanogen/methylotroph, DcmR Sensory domain